MYSAVKEYDTTENIRIMSADSTQIFRYEHLPRYKRHSDLSYHNPTTAFSYDRGSV